MEPLINIVVPWSRFKNLGKVLINYNRQNIKNKRLILVANGECHLKCSEAEDHHIILFNEKAELRVKLPKDTVVINSETHQSHAKNAGIKYVQQHNPNSYIAIFDDDDYYSHNYLKECLQYLDEKTIVGKALHFIYEHDEQSPYYGLWLMNYNFENQYTLWLTGGTHVFHSSVPSLYRVQPLSEDIDFCKELMVYHGYKVFATSPRNYVYNRFSDGKHTNPDKDIVKRYVEDPKRTILYMGNPKIDSYGNGNSTDPLVEKQHLVNTYKFYGEV